MQKTVGQYAGVSLAAAAGALRAVVALAPHCANRVQVKWPNDLLIDDRKVAGILCEQCLPSGGSGGALIVGVGLNVDMDPDELGAAAGNRATTLRILGRPTASVEGAISALARELVVALAAFEESGLNESLRTELGDRLAYVGSVRTIDMGGRKTTGRVLGIDSRGRLVLEGASGTAFFDSGELLSEARP
jgi:BirA family biotin operon repressor/biotin-[acetyl-CoA-carboxylase] ligase